MYSENLIFMKYLFCTILYILWVVSMPLYASNAEICSLLTRLDSLIAQKDVFIIAKENKIAQLQKQKKEVRTLEERYWLNKTLYDEYFVYNADSAMLYVEQNLNIASELGKNEWVLECRIKKSFLLSATGLLKEASDELQYVSSDLLSQKLKVEYYDQMMFLYSHFGQYSGGDNSEMRERYYLKEKSYQDSIYATVTPNDPFYLWYKGWKFRGSVGVESVREELLQEVTTSALETRRDAMNAYILACLYLDAGEKDNYLKFMICSGIADVRTANKDIASLEELAKVLFDLGDIDHAYNYINYCLQNAQLYRNRVRMVNIAKVQDDIRQAYQERSREQKSRLHLFLIITCVLSIVLLLAVLYILRQMKHLSYSRSQLNEANVLLNKHIEELSLAHTKLAKVNEQLQLLNEQLKETNRKLRESNYVKEEYIGYVFAICSNYISKLDEFRKNINRKIKAKQIDDIKALTDTPAMVQNELKEFYHNFDAIFLHVYPDFIRDFNALLQPDAQIVLKEGQLLNTELRIYALVRLGINDSVKIADFLHCSPQTVYNNRLKMRNKAIIPKEDFASTVMALGRMR